jgi:hypothetical protein
MSFNIVLSSSNVYATNTAGKDYTWAYDFSGKEDGDYLVSFDFQCGNITTTLVDFSGNSPIQLSVDFGSIGQMYLAGSTYGNFSTKILGLVRLLVTTVTVSTYSANNQDNFPVLFKNINKSPSFIRIKLLQADGITLINQLTGVAPWMVYLKFQKV